MSGWRRVGPWTLRTVGGALFAALGAGLAGLLGYAVVALSWPLTLGLVGWALLLAWTLYWWRTLLVGVYVDDDRIRVRTVPRTRTFAAADVVEVRTRSRRIPGGPTGIRVRELCFDLSDTRSVSTTVHGDARDGRGRAGRNVLSAPVYDMVVDRLRQHVEDAEPPPPPTTPEPEPAPERDRRDPEPPPGIIEWR